MFDPTLTPAMPLAISRRQWPRHPAGRKTVCYVHLKEGKALGPAEVRNLSRGGLSLALEKDLSPDSVAAVSLFDRGARSWSLLGVRGVYVTEHPTGAVILGGAFTDELSDEQLKAFLS